jgi:hypothetical protein
MKREERVHGLEFNGKMFCEVEGEEDEEGIVLVSIFILILCLFFKRRITKINTPKITTITLNSPP